MSTAQDEVTSIIRDFERLPPARRVELAPRLRAKLEALGLREQVTGELLREVFGPMVRKAQATLADRHAEAAENPGAVVLKGAMELAGKHPGKLDRATMSAILLGTSRHGRMEDAHGLAEGVPEATVSGLLDTLVDKGVLVEDARGRLGRRAAAD